MDCLSKDRKLQKLRVLSTGSGPIYVGPSSQRMCSTYAHTVQRQCTSASNAQTSLILFHSLSRSLYSPFSLYACLYQQTCFIRTQIIQTKYITVHLMSNKLHRLLTSHASWSWYQMLTHARGVIVLSQFFSSFLLLIFASLLFICNVLK